MTNARSRGILIAAATLLCVVHGGMPVHAEPVPEAAVVAGVPQGMFVSRSLLSGRAVCLLFLSGGRVTRFIPEGGLENLDWAAHQAAHSRDTGRWETRSGRLMIAWGDGGVHEGPLTAGADGIEFYGKRYSKPVTVSAGALAGRWEAARGMAIAGGPGVTVAGVLVVGADGRYQWVATTGGVVAGRAAASERSMTGTLRIKGATLVLTPDAGPPVSHTFLPVAGNPTTAFSLDATTFTRSSP